MKCPKENPSGDHCKCFNSGQICCYCGGRKESVDKRGPSVLLGAFPSFKRYQMLLNVIQLEAGAGMTGLHKDWCLKCVYRYSSTCASCSSGSDGKPTNFLPTNRMAECAECINNGMSSATCSTCLSGDEGAPSNYVPIQKPNSEKVPSCSICKMREVNSIASTQICADCVDFSNFQPDPEPVGPKRKVSKCTRCFYISVPAHRAPCSGCRGKKSQYKNFESLNGSVQRLRDLREINKRQARKVREKNSYIAMLERAIPDNRTLAIKNKRLQDTINELVADKMERDLKIQWLERRVEQSEREKLAIRGTEMEELLNLEKRMRKVRTNLGLIE